MGTKTPMSYDQLIITDNIRYYKVDDTKIIEEGNIDIQVQSETNLMIGFNPKNVDEKYKSDIFMGSFYVKFIGNDTLLLHTGGSDGGYAAFLFKRSIK